MPRWQTFSPRCRIYQVDTCHAGRVEASSDVHSPWIFPARIHFEVCRQDHTNSRPTTAMASLMVTIRVPPASPAQAVSSSSTCGDETTGDETEKPLVATRKRKSSYYVQREEIARLKREAEELMAKLRDAQSRQTESVIRQHVALDRQVAMNKLVIAGAQSLVANVGSAGDNAPIGSYTHLPADQRDRERILKAIKPKQIEDATLYMLARCEYADLTRPSRQVEQFATADGGQVAVLWEIAHITEGNPTARQVFDEIHQFTRIRKTALADRLTSLDIRESGAGVDVKDVAQLHIVSTHLSGLLVEKNVISHSQFFSKSALLGRPYGIFVVDPVDQDDAFPYNPCERIRQDSCSALLVTELPGDGLLLQRRVVLALYSFARTHWSHFATAEQLAQIAEDGLRACFDVMIKEVRQQFRSRETLITVDNDDPTAFIDNLLREAEYHSSSL